MEDKMKVFKLYCGEIYYGYAAQTKEEAVKKYTEDTGLYYDACRLIPESEWDKKNIKMYEDNNLDSRPFSVSIRELISGTDAQQIFTNDFSSFM